MSTLQVEKCSNEMLKINPAYDGGIEVVLASCSDDESNAHNQFTAALTTESLGQSPTVLQTLISYTACHPGFHGLASPMPTSMRGGFLSTRIIGVHLSRLRNFTTNSATTSTSHTLGKPTTNTVMGRVPAWVPAIISMIGKCVTTRRTCTNWDG